MRKCAETIKQYVHESPGTHFTSKKHPKNNLFLTYFIHLPYVRMR